MITLNEQAFAKLNLTLDILGKREDGYHELDIDSEYGFGDGTISAEQARILKNLPFAYRGYVFKSKELQDVFNRATWYIPTPSYVPNTSSLTEGERRWVNYWANYKPKVQ